VVLAAGGAVFLLAGSWVYAALVAAELAVGLVVAEARSGATVGNVALGLRAAQVARPYAPGLRRAAARAALLAAGHLALGVGQWWLVASSAVDPSGRRQGWHDRATGTVVVDVRALRRAPAVDVVPTFLEPVVSAPVRVLPAAPAPASYLITLDTGRTVAVSGAGYVGRRPLAPAGELDRQLLEIEDPGRSLSRTHAGFGIDPGGFWIEDHGSANGTYVLGADGSSVQSAPGERFIVPVGGTVRLGQRTFTVAPRA